jgi:hypothetical protein
MRIDATADPSVLPGARTAGGGGRRQMSRRGDLVTALCSAWLVFGVFLDGWAHNTRPSLETFFTPWHAVFYSGFLATTTWVVWTAGRHLRATGSWVLALPPGYGLAAWGLGLFGLSGFGDLLWHLTFGIERDLAALLSPTHLGLFVGAFLIVTAPLRSAQAGLAAPRPGWAPLLPAALSLAFAGGLTAFILQPFHPLAYSFASRGLAAMLAQRFAGSVFVLNRNIEVGLAGFMLATVFLFGPVLVLLYRWRPPVGMIAGMIATQCVLIQGVRGFRDPWLALLGAIGAVAVEGLTWALRPDGTALARLRAFCAAAPPVFWGIYLGGVALHDGGLGWSPELWGGALVWSSLTLLAFTILMPARTVSPAVEPAVPGPATMEAGAPRAAPRQPVSRASP